jgi:hypothetical protein
VRGQDGKTREGDANGAEDEVVIPPTHAKKSVDPLTKADSSAVNLGNWGL